MLDASDLSRIERVIGRALSDTERSLFGALLRERHEIGRNEGRREARRESGVR